MDRKSKYLIWGFTLIFVLSVGWGYKNFIVDRNFVINSTTECDPYAESCFVWCEDGVCEEDYYKKIAKKAVTIPVCNPAEEECEPLSCGLGEEGCAITLCSAETVEEGEACTNLLDFQVSEDSTELNTASTTETEQ